MKKTDKYFKKYAALLMIAVSAIVLMQEALFAQGAVVGYVNGRTDEIPVSNDQLEKLTHAMVYNLFVNADGSITPNTGWEISMTAFESLLKPLVKDAHEGRKSKYCCWRR